MKRWILLALLVVQSTFWAGPASAAACASGSLDSYNALGSSGCTIGSLTFSDFVLRPPANGAITSSAITVTPVVIGGLVVGLTFGVSAAASGGFYYDDLIGYRVTAVGAGINGATVDFAGSSATGDAAVSVAENLCLGGSFGPDGVSGCSSGSTVDLAVIDIGFGPDPAYSLPFGTVAFLSVATDIAYDSGSGFVPDSASTLTSGTNLFDVVAVRAVPEPASGLLLAVGVLGLALVPRRRRERRGD